MQAILLINGRRYSAVLDDLSNGTIVDIDFEGKYMLQFEFNEGILYPTGNGMDGGGHPLGGGFYREMDVFIDDEV